MLRRLVRSLIPLLSITILIVAVCSASVRGQELPKQEPGKPPDTKQHSGTYTRGTKDSPVAIEIGPSAPLKIEADHDTEAEKAKSVNEGRIATGTIVIAVFTLVLAFATICLAVFTYKLWGATGKLVRWAEETAQQQLRAYVNVDRVEFAHVKYSPINDATRLWIHVRFKNSGQIPATRLEWWSLVGTDEFPLRTALVGERALQRIGVIPPHDTFTAKMELGAMDNPDTNAAFYVCGEIQYFDGFVPGRVTQLLYMRRGGDDWSWDGELDVCQEGNHIT